MVNCFDLWSINFELVKISYIITFLHKFALLFSKQLEKRASRHEFEREVAEKFESRWHFPNGLGAVDGKHIVIQQPKNSGSHYRNYKGGGSIILMDMIGPEYEFLFADVGMNGRNWWQLVTKFLKVCLRIYHFCQMLNFFRVGKRRFHLYAQVMMLFFSFLMKPYPRKGWQARNEYLIIDFHECGVFRRMV